MRAKKHKFRKALKRRLLRDAGFSCQVCGTALVMATAEPHHIIPVSCGGETTYDNGMIVCRPCHVSLHKKQEVEL